MWAIRFWLDRERRLRDGRLFDLAIDSKLHGCDVVKIRVGDLVSGGRIRTRAMVVQQKTGRPVQFELLEPARTSMLAWLERRGRARSMTMSSQAGPIMPTTSTRRYRKVGRRMGTGIGLHGEDTVHASLRRKASIIYKATGNLRAVQILLGRRKFGAQFATSALI